MEEPVPAIACLEDLKAAQKGFCAVFVAFSPNALRLTPNPRAFEGRVRNELWNKQRRQKWK